MTGAATGLSLERYVDRASPLHRADARAKLPAVLGYVVAIALTREGDWIALALLAAPIAALVIASRLQLALVLRRSLIAAPAFLVALPLLVTREGEALATFPVVGWEATEEGARAVLTIVTKSWLSVVVAVLLTATTPMPALLGALRWLRVPRLLVATVAFAYRYLFVVADEAGRMLRARASRSAALPGRRAGRSLRWRARVAGHLAGTLFVRSIDRAERVYAAMLARGYDGEMRSLSAPPLVGAQLAAGAALVLFGALVQLGVRA